MAGWLNRQGRAALIGAAGVIGGILLASCGRKEAAPETQPPSTPASASSEKEGPPLEPRLNQSFAEATLPEPPADCRLPDVTATGKSVGKLYTEVMRLWNGIRFTAPGGKPLEYRATIETDMGVIRLTLWPDLAPNHVRSFVALARAGYYDGLVFERTVRETAADQPEARMELIEAGCPMGTGEMGYGSIGYWLLPEVAAGAKHEVGVLAAAHGAEGDLDACKFYINLCPAPFLDGSFTVFGKVVEGLEVARKILEQPVRDVPDAPEGNLPVKPVVIRQVTIQTEERTAAGPQ